MTLTVETILDAAAVLGDHQKVGLYSHRLFLKDRTIRFKVEDGEVFHVAHPEFWDRAAVLAFANAPTIKTDVGVRTIWGIPLIDLDANVVERLRVARAMAKALPRWEHQRDAEPRHYWPIRNPTPLLNPDAT